MKREIHYYAILALCRACGFTKKSAQIIAYASQFVDDAKINLMYIHNPNHYVEHDILHQRPVFFNMATCHTYYRIKTFNYEDMVNNTCAFHFVPGCEGENFTKKLRCKEASPVILELVNDALLEDDLIKLGIVLHVYADSFSHQGFSGILSMVNDIQNCKAQTELYLNFFDNTLLLFKQFRPKEYEKLFDGLIPAYGHGQATDFPDIPYLKWSYAYDKSEKFNGSYQVTMIDNRERYLRALYSIKSYLENYLIKHPQYLDPTIEFKDFELFTNVLLMTASDRKREVNWVSFILKQGFYHFDDLEFIIYSDKTWLQEAFSNYNLKYNNRIVEEVQLADDFITSNWYHFYLAVKWYKKMFFQYCNKYQLFFPY